MSEAPIPVTTAATPRANAAGNAVALLSALLPVKYRSLVSIVATAAAAYTGGYKMAETEPPLEAPLVPPPFLSPGEMVLDMDHVRWLAAGHAARGKKEGLAAAAEYLALVPPDITAEKALELLLAAFPEVKP